MLSNPMRWVNRLLYNNDIQAIARLYAGVKVTSVQAIEEERSIQTKVVELVTLTPAYRRAMACLSFLLQHISVSRLFCNSLDYI